MRKLVTAVFVSITASSAAFAAPTTILFVGNSYTFGRVDPVLSYNTGNVDDMTRPRPADPGQAGCAPGRDTADAEPIGTETSLRISATALPCPFSATSACDTMPQQRPTSSTTTRRRIRFFSIFW